MIQIKRYTNRKLYNTTIKRYITLDQIAEYLESGEEVQIVDHPTNQDITVSILTQIIFESSRKEGFPFPLSSLKDLFQKSSYWIRNSSEGISNRLSIAEWINYEIDRRITGLVNIGLIEPEEGDRLINLLCSYPKTLENEANIEDRIQTILSFLQVPTRRDIDQLTEQLNGLQLKLEQRQSSYLTSPVDQDENQGIKSI
jgi:polyhydroxyalkanoate synthesis repressor PhaR